MKPKKKKNYHDEQDSRRLGQFLSPENIDSKEKIRKKCYKI